MVIKSLTITEEAYNRLKAMKMGNESFSKAIIRISNTKVGAAAKFFGMWKDDPGAVDELKRRIKERRAVIDREFSERQKKIRARLG